MSDVQRTFFVAGQKPKAAPCPLPGAKPKKSSEPNRKTRLQKSVSPTLRDWLMRTTRVHAHLCSIVRLYGRPERAGGQSNEGEAYAARAARGDPTLLEDAYSHSIEELVELREEVRRVIYEAQPTAALPGSRAKVEELARRARAGKSLFFDKDAKHC